MMSSGKKSWFFFLPAWMHDEEEGTALVASSHHDGDDEQKQPPASADDDDHPKEEEEMMKEPPAASCHEETKTKTKEAGSSSSRSSAAAWWRLLLPTTRGAVGLVISGLIFLALLLTTTTTWWTHLDYSSSSFLLGSSSNGRTERGERGPHHSASANNLNLLGTAIPIPFSCGNNSSSSPSSSSMTRTPPNSSSSSEEAVDVMCPDYFRYIHSDLSPWRDKGGITREAVESAQPRAAFRLTVVNGRAFVETYHRVFQTRDTFTKWGIAQLLARYPGRVPDLDLMFNCEDMPEIRNNDQSTPPLFRYCKDDSTLDIVFPDWSFWGWPEVNIRPWAPLLEDIIANDVLPWTEKTPYAYWKGNAGVSAARRDLLRCNGTDKNNACVLFNQDWRAAIRNGFKDGSNLAEQCRYRYKIFVQGRSWSVSQKYILACNSPVLLVDTPFRDFVSRGLVAGDHYWPIDPKRKCPAIKFAVDWGNDHAVESERMAREGSGFARRQMAIDYVYDYMLHLLTEYAKLLRYKPVVPENAVELLPETVACPSISRGTEFEFMMQSRETHVAAYQPCKMPPPFTAQDLQNMARRDKQVRGRVNKMMRNYYKHK
ncbi:hypothetical protein QOZ80_8AG0614220 [Eleusine coracana subsp. coracana]|nr:hypothetical protein QOZ80_8AG0614220 [Eleusine coracana subsp. coracana]